MYIRQSTNSHVFYNFKNVLLQIFFFQKKKYCFDNIYWKIQTI